MEKLLEKIYRSKNSVTFLQTVSYISVALGALGFLAVLYLSYEKSLLEAVKVLVMHAVPFAVVSVFRHFFNAKRPYEVYSFYDARPKDKCGKSFPSRHVFSAFIIATFALRYSLLMGILLLALGFLLALARVLLGIHFVRDCVAGALIGIASAVIGILVL